MNGQDYVGNYPFTFIDKLEIYKISPLAGPIGGSTKVKLFGHGFTSEEKSNVFVKFGTIEVQPMTKADVADFTWSEEEYHKEFNFPANLLKPAEENDKLVEEGTTVKKYVAAASPDITRAYLYESPDVKGLGGPVYVQVGENVPIKEIDHQGSSKEEKVDQIETVYHDSS